jgi:flagellar basal-body rod protein FlgG
VQLQTGSINTQAGPMSASQNPLGAALSDSNDYFSVQTPQGVRYTRNGDFHLDNSGNLVDSQGDQVLGLNGALSTTPGNGASLTAQGQFQAVGADPEPLKIVNLDPAVVQRQGGQLFAIPANSAPGDAKGSVIPGQLEGSGVDVFKGMADLVMLMRWDESAQKAARAADDAASTLIQTAKL